MLKYQDCEAIFSFAATMGRRVAQGEDEQEALAKLQGAVVMFMMLTGLSSSILDYVYNMVFDRYQEGFNAYFEDKEEDEQE